MPGVYAAGDTAAAVAEPGHTVMQSCQHAVPQGEFVGHNRRRRTRPAPGPFARDPYGTCLDLGAPSSPSGWDRTVQLTGQEAKDLKRNINGSWIYPPVDDAELILNHADWRTTWPTAEVSNQQEMARDGERGGPILGVIPRRRAWPPPGHARHRPAARGDGQPAAVGAGGVAADRRPGGRAAAGDLAAVQPK